MLALETGDDLRFGLDLQHAQLTAQTRHGLLEFHQVEAVTGNLLFQSRTVDGDFAGMVDQVVEQVGADTDLLLRGADLFLHFRQQFGQVERRLTRCCRLLGRANQLQGRHRHSGQGLVVSQGLFARQCKQAIDHGLRIFRCLTLRHMLYQRMHLIERRFQRSDQRACLGGVASRLFEHGLNRVGEITHGRQTSNTRAALERMQITLQFGHVLQFTRIIVPLREHAIGVIENFTRLVDEHFK
jgi:hypothetical protein